MRRLFSTLLRFAVVTLLSCVGSAANVRADDLFTRFMNDATNDSAPVSFEEELLDANVDFQPLLAAPTSNYGIWRSLASSDESFEYRPFSIGDYDDYSDDSVGYFSDYADLIVRGQIQPPVVSPSTSTTYGSTTYTYDMASEGAVNPPVTMEDPTTLRRVFKYQQDCSKSFVYIPRTKNGLGVIEGGTGLYFAFPCEAFRNGNINQGVFRLTPTFNYTNFSKPKDRTFSPTIPKNVFDAGLATSFSLAVNDLEATVEVQGGIASEFRKITGKSFYLRGRAEGSLPVDDERKTRILGGVAYYNRIKFKILPVAGVVWKPNANNEIRLVFPDPRWGHFLVRNNGTDWWFFVSGDLGGGRWLMTDVNHPVKGKKSFNIDYNDYRVTTGLVFDCPQGFKGSFEVGGSFGRELKTKEGSLYKPKSAVILKAGLFF